MKLHWSPDASQKISLKNGEIALVFENKNMEAAHQAVLYLLQANFFPTEQLKSALSVMGAEIKKRKEGKEEAKHLHFCVRCVRTFDDRLEEKDWLQDREGKYGEKGSIHVVHKYCHILKTEGGS